MGMFDSFYFYGTDANLVCCKAGHPQRNCELQTKDLDCSMAHYYVYDNGVYSTEKSTTEIRYENCMLKEVVARPLKLETTINETVTMYGHCEECTPVVYETESSFMGYVNHKYPWVEFDVEIKNGKVQSVVLSKGQTSQELAETMKKDGVSVLDSDDRAAQRYLRKLNEE